MVSFWINLVMVILSAVWSVEQEGGPSGQGAQKKADALAKITGLLDGPTGPSWPNWFPKATRDWIIGWLIDIAVGKLQGFFGK